MNTQAVSGKKGLSILIPVFNYEIAPLVIALEKQTKKLDIPYEIRCYDDGSDIWYKKRNRRVDWKNFLVYKEMEFNLGRSKIRNLLADDATFDNLLFIDCDSKVLNDKFIEQYLIKAFSHDVVFGGTEYALELDNPEHSLRWKYGRKREVKSSEYRNLNPYDNITLNNLFVTKDVFNKCRLDETITTYGHEDTKFAFALKQQRIAIAHIDNPVEHIGLEPNHVYLDKTLEGVRNLLKISRENAAHETRLYKSFKLMKKSFLAPTFKFFYGIFQKHIENNLTSKNPMLLYFDLYKLNLILMEDEKKLMIK